MCGEVVCPPAPGSMSYRGTVSRETCPWASRGPPAVRGGTAPHRRSNRSRDASREVAWLLDPSTGPVRKNLGSPVTSGPLLHCSGRQRRRSGNCAGLAPACVGRRSGNTGPVGHRWPAESGDSGRAETRGARRDQRWAAWPSSRTACTRLASHVWPTPACGRVGRAVGIGRKAGHDGRPLGYGDSAARQGRACHCRSRQEGPPPRPTDLVGSHCTRLGAGPQERLAPYGRVR